MNLKILNKNGKQEIIRDLNKQFGIKEIPGLIFTLGSERLFLFSGRFDSKQIQQLERMIPIERLGVYFAKQEVGYIRLSIEGTQILKNQITKNIFELTESQAEEWMMGRELLFSDIFGSDNNLSAPKALTGGREREFRTKSKGRVLPKGFVVMKYKDNFLGCGKASAEKIGNFIPKNRRLKERG